MIFYLMTGYWSDEVRWPTWADSIPGTCCRYCGITHFDDWWCNGCILLNDIVSLPWLIQWLISSWRAMIWEGYYDDLTRPTLLYCLSQFQMPFLYRSSEGVLLKYDIIGWLEKWYYCYSLCVNTWSNANYSDIWLLTDIFRYDDYFVTVF